MRPVGVPMDSRMLPCTPRPATSAFDHGAFYHLAVLQEPPVRAQTWSALGYADCREMEAFARIQFLPDTACLWWYESWTPDLHCVAKSPVTSNADCEVAPSHKSIRHIHACRFQQMGNKRENPRCAMLHASSMVQA